jgi:DNA-directed RNA polymerase specialized sigma24 family protein
MAGHGSARVLRYSASPEPVGAVQPDCDVVEIVDGAASREADEICALHLVEAATDRLGRMARDAAASLERRGADLELRNRLAADNFEGPLWDAFSDELAAYGIAVLRAWCASGYVFTMCARRRVPLSPTDADFEIDRDTRDELIFETVSKGIMAFKRHALIGQRWQFHGGATLKTYFIGACVYAFAGVFRRWRTAEKQWRSGLRCQLTMTIDSDVVGADPAIDVAIRDLILDELRGITKERSRAAVALTVDGYTQEEIAETLGMTGPRAVEGVLRRVREGRIKRERGEHDDGR